MPRPPFSPRRAALLFLLVLAGLCALACLRTDLRALAAWAVLDGSATDARARGHARRRGRDLRLEPATPRRPAREHARAGGPPWGAPHVRRRRGRARPRGAQHPRPRARAPRGVVAGVRVAAREACRRVPQ
jgi:hypothetical protein